MSEIIRQLPDSIANQIAAGEVIQRPSSMLKELVENAIDAHATHITIELQDAGKSLMRVLDDGSGMSPLDARMAFERHATSKISSIDDLFRLQSMGFRGEALASIAAVAQIELETRPADQEIGHKLLINGSEVIDEMPTMCDVGTSISVKNLFFNVPARRRFLKSNDTELRHVITQFERIALVYPEISFRLYSEGKILRDLPKALLQHRITALLGRTLSQNLIPISLDNSICRISGFITAPRDAKKRGAHQYFFVNGRYMKHPYFHRAVMSVFQDLIPVGSQPNYFIYFQVPPDKIDVNIHPTKTEIKFLEEQAVFQFIVLAIRNHLSATSAIPSISFDEAKLIDIPAYDSQQATGEVFVPKPQVSLDSTYNPFKQQVEDPLKAASSASSPRKWQSLIEDFRVRKGEDTPKTVHTPHIELELPQSASRDSESNSSRCLGYVYKQQYIITALGDKLAIIDIERALLRIYYAQQMSQCRLDREQPQPLLFAEEMILSSELYPDQDEIISELVNMGFQISAKECAEPTYLISAVPKPIKPVNVVQLLVSVINRYLDESNPEISLEEILISELALRAATEMTKSNYKQESAQPNRIVSELFITPNPNYDPTGRPILTTLSDEDLAKWFR